MDAAKTLARWKELAPEQWIAAANRVLPPVVTGALVLALAYELAALTWALVPSGDPVPPAPEVAPPASGARAEARDPGLDALAGAELFGEPPAEAPAASEQVVDAPDTTLSLQLTGIVARGTSGERGQAIIASSRDEEKIYSVGDTIDSTNGATLHAVYSDRIILNRGAGRLEALRLPRELAAQAAGGRRTSTARPPSSSASGQGPGALRDVISDNASQITEVIRPSPQIEGGEVIGFRVNPGRNREAFDALGLEPGDVVTDVNGTALNDASAGLKLFESLGEASMANVTVLRDGSSQVLVVDMSQIENLAENME